MTGADLAQSWTIVLTSSRITRSTTLRPKNSGVLFTRPRQLGGEFLLMTMGARQPPRKFARSSANWFFDAVHVHQDMTLPPRLHHTLTLLPPCPLPQPSPHSHLCFDYKTACFMCTTGLRLNSRQGKSNPSHSFKTLNPQSQTPNPHTL